MSRKIYVLDTSVLAFDPDAWGQFQEHEVVIPAVVLQELDGLKERHGSLGYAAREACRNLEVLCHTGNVLKGIDLSDGGILRIDSCQREGNFLPPGFDLQQPDNTILAIALHIARKKEQEMVLVSKDTNLRLKALSVGGLGAEDYRHGQVKETSIVPEMRTIKIQNKVIDAIHRENDISVEEVADEALLPNECLILKGTKKGKSALVIHKDGYLHLVTKGEMKRGVQPRNAEQAFAYALATDPDIPLVSFSGNAGTGKTLMALLAAYDLVLPKATSYRRVQVFRPMVELGQELGFMPGDLDEKYSPWMMPILANMRLISSNRKDGDADVKRLIDEGILTVGPINHIRGATFHNTVIVLDEAQNFTPREMKALVTRAGEGTKIIAVGDLGQVDSAANSDPRSCGLAHLIERFKGDSLHAHLKLVKGERSKLAEKAGQLL